MAPRQWVYGEESLGENVVPEVGQDFEGLDVPDVGGSNPAKDTTEEAVKGGLSTIAIVGIVAACVVFLALVAAIIAYFVRKTDEPKDGDLSKKIGNEGSNTTQEINCKSLLRQITISNSSNADLVLFKYVLANVVSGRLDVTVLKYMLDQSRNIRADDIDIPQEISNQEYIKKGVVCALNDFLAIMNGLKDSDKGDCDIVGYEVNAFISEIDCLDKNSVTIQPLNSNL